MAKIRQADAERIALKNITAKDSDKKVSDCELEVERGYLVYSVEVKVSGKDGVDELLIDAGNGKVLSREHESGEGEEKEEE